MNFLQLAERVTEEVNGLPLTLSSVDLGKSDGLYIVPLPEARRAIRATQQAFDWIMGFSRHWTFLNKRGEIFRLVPGISEYSRPLIESVDWNSLYLTKAGSSVKWPIYQELYSVWQDDQRSTVPTSGAPIYLVRATSPARWIVWPTPTEQWVLNGNWQQAKMRLEAATDEPPWEEKYHELVVWRAVLLIEGRRRVDQDTQLAENLSTAQRSFSSLWTSFMTAYLPEFRGARALL